LAKDLELQYLHLRNGEKVTTKYRLLYLTSAVCRILEYFRRDHWKLWRQI